MPPSRGKLPSVAANRGGMPSSHTSSAIVADATTGSHVLRIQGYSRLKGSNHGIKSEKFAVGSHRWYMEYYPDGCGSGNGDWISVCLGRLAGPGADQVRAKFSLTLLDHGGEPVPYYSCESRDICVFGESSVFGYDQFVQRKELEESVCLKDDAFSLRCDVTMMDIRTEPVVPAVKVPPSNMPKDFGRLLSTRKGMDVKFKVAGKTFCTHKSVLAARSSVFEAQVFGPMKEKARNSCVRIDDMEPRVFKAMRHFIYTDSLPEMSNQDESTAMDQHLLVAADRYNLQRLKLICEEKLCKNIDTKTAATSLALAEQHGFQGLKRACFKFLKSVDNMRAVKATDGFKHLTRTWPSIMDELIDNLAP